MPDRTPDYMPDKMPEHLPDRTPEDMPDKMPDYFTSCDPRHDVSGRILIFFWTQL